MTKREAEEMSVDKLGLSTRPLGCLRYASIDTVYQAATLTVDDYLRIRNFGKKSLEEIKAKFEESGLHFGMKDGEWERDSSGTDGDAAEKERRVGKLVLELFSILNARSTNRKDRQGK